MLHFWFANIWHRPDQQCFALQAYLRTLHSIPSKWRAPDHITGRSTTSKNQLSIASSTPDWRWVIYSPCRTFDKDSSTLLCNATKDDWQKCLWKTISHQTFTLSNDETQSLWPPRWQTQTSLRNHVNMRSFITDRNITGVLRKTYSQLF